MIAFLSNGACSAFRGHRFQKVKFFVGRFSSERRPGCIQNMRDYLLKGSHGHSAYDDRLIFLIGAARRWR